MKKIVLTSLLIFAVSMPLFAQEEIDEQPAQEATEQVAEEQAAAEDQPAEETSKKSKGTWTTSSTPALKIDQVYYNNWSAAGNSQLALTASFNGTYKYTNGKDFWDNIVDLAFGIHWQDLDSKNSPLLESLRKNEDKIDLTSTYSRNLKGAWNVNAIANFKTQFYKGYQYGEDTIMISNILAPAYLTTALGFEYKKEWWNLSLSFLTGKTTFVCSDSLIKNGYNYGVIQDTDFLTTGHYRHAYFGLGSYVKFYMKKDIAKNLNLYVRAELFYDYMKRSNLQRESGIRQELVENGYGNWNYGKKLGYCLYHEMDFDLEVKLEYRFSSWLAAYAGFQMRYDSDFRSVNEFGQNVMNKGAMGALQFFQTAGLQIYFNWKTPKEA
ncbi:MAG: DUF3078 domain-containing protein [Bacteroidales bacterium]|nr:DUF3078 domain-containing protein [Bacteroidales bacterium]